ncbi:MAG: proprotein convertase P-domain-containing protein, partial [Bernardetiaceae bacterium]|nr:proprotein convertase P-domain-containing protein [Bernardetiaceae bacterium]
MKYTLLFYLTIFFAGIAVQNVYAQGATCADADPLCATTGATFPAATTGFAQTGPNYGCLLSQPRPAWYYLEIDDVGPIEISLFNSAEQDIDFAIWGPFAPGTSASAICATNMDGQAPDDCSFSALAYPEIININPTASGQVYILLITNYTNAPTDITVTQTGGTGSTDCGAVCLMTGTMSWTGEAQVCNLDGITEDYTASVTNADNITYTLSPAAAGTIDTNTGEVTWNAAFSGTATITAMATAANCDPIVGNFEVDVTQINTDLIASENPFCLGDNITFTADPTNENAASYEYEFFVNGVSQGAPSTTKTFSSATLADGDEVTVQIFAGATSPTATTYSSTGGPATISTGAAAPMSIYPWNINVAGVSGPLTNVQVRLNNLTHTWRGDISMLLVAPDGTMVTLMGRIGGGGNFNAPNTITLEAGAPLMPTAGAITGVQTYSPNTAGGTYTYPAPGPGAVSPAMAPTDMTLFNGGNPNGDWSLYVVDHAFGDGGGLASWDLILTPEPASCDDMSDPITMSAAPPTVEAVCQDITIQLDAAGNATATAAAVDNGSQAGCGATIESMTLSQTAFDCSNIGANTVTLTVTDSDGNSDNCTATITVEDSIAPVAVCQAVTIQLDTDGNATLTPAAVNNGSSDNCTADGDLVLSLSQTAFDCSHLGTNTVTLTVEDEAGNISTCDATITVGDTIAPTIVCPATQTVSADANCEYTLADYTALATVDDNCPTGLVVTQSPAIGSLQSDVTLVTLTVTDLSGNSTECNFNVEAEDVTAPVAVCQAVTIQLDADGNA